MNSYFLSGKAQISSFKIPLFYGDYKSEQQKQNMLYQMTHQELPGFYVTVRANWYTDLE
jgi:hypothetical protein